MDLAKEVKNNIKKYKKENLIVAVSGGIDSVVLLNILCRIFDKKKMVVAHFDHRLRKSSEGDKNFVKNLARCKNLRFVSGKASNLTSKKGSLEENAREARYNFLLKTAKKNNSKFIITAHHADDQLETVFMNLKRGAFIEGLTGMNFETELSSGFFIVRPMLNIIKRDIISYQKYNNIDFVEDETNKDKSFLRNNIRHNILKDMNNITKVKLLQKINDLSLENENIKNDIFIALNRVLLKQCKATVILNRTFLGKLSKSIISEIIKLVVIEINGNLNNIYQSNIVDSTKLVISKKSGLKLNLPNNIKIIIDNDRIIFTKKEIRETITFDQKLKMGLNKIKNQSLALNLSISNRIDKQKINLDFNKVKFPLRAVSYKEGMRIKLKNTGTKKLQDIFVDKKIEKRYRKNFPVLIDEKGKLIAIIDLAVSESCFPDRKTVKYLLIDIKA